MLTLGTRAGTIIKLVDAVEFLPIQLATIKSISSRDPSGTSDGSTRLEVLTDLMRASRPLTDGTTLLRLHWYRSSLPPDPEATPISFRESHNPIFEGASMCAKTSTGFVGPTIVTAVRAPCIPGSHSSFVLITLSRNSTVSSGTKSPFTPRRIRIAVRDCHTHEAPNPSFVTVDDLKSTLQSVSDGMDPRFVALSNWTATERRSSDIFARVATGDVHAIGVGWQVEPYCEHSVGACDCAGSKTETRTMRSKAAFPFATHLIGGRYTRPKF
mmetsp:Transcript_5223/g.9942  ORF Transcript_5223/g.9942 Transcript_5223/m.9942 type:complete len:270 (-) Transcript_5223:11-820(-)